MSNKSSKNKGESLRVELYELVQRDAMTFDFIQEHCIDGMWFLDATEKSNFWPNPRFLTELGYSPNQADFPEDWLSIVHPEDVPHVSDAIQSALVHPNDPLEIKIRYLEKAGSYRPMLCRGKLITDAKGTPYRIIGGHTAISQENKGGVDFEQEKNKENEHVFNYYLFNAVLNSSEDLIFLKDENFRYILFNAAVLSFYKLPKQGIHGKTDFEIFQQDFANESRRTDIMILDSEAESITYERSLNDRLLEIKKYPVRLLDGKMGIGAIARDITEYKQKQFEIKQNRQLLENLAQQVTGLLYQLETSGDGKRKWIYLTERVEEIYGITSEQLQEDPELLHNLIHPEDRSKYNHQLMISLQELSNFQMEHRIITKSGQVKWLMVQAKPQRIGHKKTVWYGFVNEITKRKNAELSALEASTKLEKSNSELLRREQMLISISQATDQLLSNQNLEEAICQSVGILSRGTGSDQGFYFSIKERAGDLFAYHIYEWFPDKAPRFHIPNMQGVPETSFPEAWKAIRQGIVYQILIKDIPEGVPHKKIYVKNEVKSTIFIPVMIQERPVGLIGFDDCNTERIWSNAEIALLQSFASSIAHAMLRIQTETKLLKTTEMLYQTSEMARVGGWEMNLNTQELTWTDMVRKIHEVPDDFHPTYESFFAFHKEEKQKQIVKNHIERTISRGTPLHFEAQIVTQKGRNVWIRAIGEAEFEGDTCQRIYGAFQDIDREKKLTLSLAKKTHEFNEMIGIIPVGIFRYTQEGKFSFVSPTWCRMNGLKEREILAHPDMAFIIIHPEDREKIKIDIRRAIKEKQILKYEARYQIKNELRWMRLYAEPHQKEDNTWEWYGIQVDITETKQNEELLLRKNEQLRSTKEESESILRQYIAILDSQSVYVIKIDLLGNYIYINNYYKNRFGNKDLLLGANSIDLVVKEDQKLYKKTIGQCVKHPEKAHEVIIRKHANNGNVLGGKWEFKSVLNDKGEVTEVQCVGFDITEQLENLVRLQELLDLTSEQNQRLNSFTHIVSHNIRSHTANFIGLLKLLNDQTSPDEAKLFLQMLTSSAEQLEQTIVNLNEVLSVTENINQTKTEHNILKEVQNTLEILKGDIIKHDVEVYMDIDAGITVTVVSAYLDSILLNLLSNAIKYRSHDINLIIKISAKVQDKYILVAIEDNGKGLDLDRYGHKLFGLYNTFHGNADAKGFGLFITKNQIESMGGKIAVESSPNKGAKFLLYFPKNAKKR